MNKESIELLVKKALESRNYSYVPYSGFAVGAALLTKEGKVVTGCNIENSAYGSTVCAERTAIFKAVSDGMRNFQAIAIAGGPKGHDPEDYAFPCGACRQVMREFCDPLEFNVIIAKSETNYKCFKLQELLPFSFGPSNLSKLH